MESAPDSPGATNSKAFYQQLLASGAKQWADCSNDGEALHGDGDPYCLCASILFWFFLRPILSVLSI